MGGTCTKIEDAPPRQDHTGGQQACNSYQLPPPGYHNRNNQSPQRPYQQPPQHGGFSGAAVGSPPPRGPPPAALQPSPHYQPYRSPRPLTRQEELQLDATLARQLQESEMRNSSLAGTRNSTQSTARASSSPQSPGYDTDWLGRDTAAREREIQALRDFERQQAAERERQAAREQELQAEAQQRREQREREDAELQVQLEMQREFDQQLEEEERLFQEQIAEAQRISQTEYDRSAVPSAVNTPSVDNLAVVSPAEPGLPPRTTTVSSAGGRECTICFEKLRPSSSTFLPCAHGYHTACIRSWLTRSDDPLCPICKLQIPQQLVDGI